MSLASSRASSSSPSVLFSSRYSSNHPSVLFSSRYLSPRRVLPSSSRQSSFVVASSRPPHGRVVIRRSSSPRPDARDSSSTSHLHIPASMASTTLRRDAKQLPNDFFDRPRTTTTTVTKTETTTTTTADDARARGAAAAARADDVASVDVVEREGHDVEEDERELIKAQRTIAEQIAMFDRVDALRARAKAKREGKRSESVAGASESGETFGDSTANERRDRARMEADEGEGEGESEGESESESDAGTLTDWRAKRLKIGGEKRDVQGKAKRRDRG